MIYRLGTADFANDQQTVRREVVIYVSGTTRYLSVRIGQAENGGRGGIRTHGELAPSLVFKTSSLNRSDTLP